MTPRQAFTVKKPATTIITTATAKFMRIMLMDAIHPLTTKDIKTDVSFLSAHGVQQKFVT